MTGKLNLDPALVARARELARRAGEPVTELARTHTTVSVERAVLRLAGLDGADEDGMPWVNRLTDAVRESAGLEHGVALPAWDAMLTGGYPDLRTLAVDAAAGLVKFRLPAGQEGDAARDAAARSVRKGISRIDAQRAERDRMLAVTSNPPMPWIYLIVATGDIYEDIPQAQAAAREGADVIAVIRSTGQSLLDYVPEGATREGYAGTYATQENFRLMRAALDDVSTELGRYVRLTNYASGLCMPEIASLAGLERLDMMLNDCMYGIIFRDINPVRTFIDQRFSRQVHARAGIVINTGEDNYLTTADAVDAAHTVVVSQLLNEYFGREAGLADAQLGLGHAFEINPELPDSFLLELAHAQLVRELFPDAPLKYMPPTKHMTGNVFAGYLLDAFFNLCGVMTDQSILLIGMMTEGIHTPFLSDRDLALENVRYVRRAAGRLGQEFRPEPDGFVAQRARQVLGESVDLLRKIGSQGLLNAIAEGTFGVTKRPADGGRGLDGVVERAEGYYNPASDMLEAQQMETERVSLTGTMGLVRPYGDTTGDGRVQLSFTLPVPFGDETQRARAEGAALQLAAKMGLDPAMVVHAKGMGPDFTFFIVYGRVSHIVDLSAVTVTEREFPVLPAAEVNLRIRSALGRKLVVVGACIGTDAHTVGIDAILNVKGHAGEKGLEYYREIRVVNMGSQVGVADLVARAVGRARRRGAGQSGRHAARRPSVEHPGDVGRVPRRVRPAAAAARGGRPPVRSQRGARPRRGQDLRPRHHARRGGQLPGARLAPAGPGGWSPAGKERRQSGMSIGFTVTQRRYVKHGDAHYGGNLVDGAYVLGLFGDVATETCIRMDGDEGLFASYSDVQFRAPVLAGDVIEATATVTAIGRRSRQLAFEARVVCRAELARGESAASVLDEPIVVVTAAGTVVVPSR